jgi:hypothetical protein
MPRKILKALFYEDQSPSESFFKNSIFARNQGGARDIEDRYLVKAVDAAASLPHPIGTTLTEGKSCSGSIEVRMGRIPRSAKIPKLTGRMEMYPCG